MKNTTVTTTTTTLSISLSSRQRRHTLKSLAIRPLKNTTLDILKGGMDGWMGERGTIRRWTSTRPRHLSCRSGPLGTQRSSIKGVMLTERQFATGYITSDTIVAWAEKVSADWLYCGHRRKKPRVIAGHHFHLFGKGKKVRFFSLPVPEICTGYIQV